MTETERESVIGPNEWKIVRAEDLHGRPGQLIGGFYKQNPRLKRMEFFRVNAAKEYEGVVEGFVGDTSEMGEMPDNPSLWVAIGVMTNAGDFVAIYKPI